MSLIRPTYLVEYLTDPDDDTTATVHTVQIMYGDQLRAELEAGKNMVDMTAQPFALTSLWVWASMTRQGLTDLPWQTWKSHVGAIGKGEAAELDPTQPAPATGSP